MAFTSVSEDVFSSTLVEVKKLNDESFNPSDYTEFTTPMKTELNELSTIANILARRSITTSSRRILSEGVDRATGEVLQPLIMEQDENEVSCVKFDKADVLFHKVRARIGRIGIADFDGCCENEFLTVKPTKTNAHYLLLALRSHDVLVQLPPRETARPRIKRKDVSRLKIPRLGDVEEKIGTFISRVFVLRKRARTVLRGLLDNFDKGISSKMPMDYSFSIDVQTLSDDTLDPGFYFMKALEWTFPKNVEINDSFTIIQPSSAKSGTNFAIVTIKDFEFEGIKPLLPKKADAVPLKAYAKVGDVILNKMHSKEKAIAKATVIGKNLGYLKETGLSVQEIDGETRVPVYSELLILRQKPSSHEGLSPYYLALMLNSRLFRHMFTFIMSGSTGRQRIRKEKLMKVKVPTLETHMMKSFSEASRICLEVSSETLRMLTLLSKLYEKVVRGYVKAEELISFIAKETNRLQELEGNTIEEAMSETLKTVGLMYLA